MNRQAMQIYLKLLQEGQIDSKIDSELYLGFKNNDVRDELSVMEEELGFELLEVGQTIYIIPNMDNEVLSGNVRDLRDSISSTASLTDTYLYAYISMIIFYLFFGGKNNNPKQRDFLLVKELIREIDTRFDTYIDANSAMVEIDDEYGLNFKKIAEYWTSKQLYESGKIKTKEGTVIKVCRRLEKEKLIRLVDDNTEIRPTKRLQDIFINYYLNEKRIHEIHEILNINTAEKMIG